MARTKVTTPTRSVIPPPPSTTSLHTVTIAPETPTATTTLIGCITLPCHSIKPSNKAKRVLSPFHKELIAVSDKYSLFAYCTGQHFFITRTPNILNLLRNLEATPDESGNFTLESNDDETIATIPNEPELIRLDHTENITKIAFSTDSTIFYVVFESFFEVYSMKQVVNAIARMEVLQYSDPIAAYTLNDPPTSITNVIYVPPTLLNPVPFFAVHCYDNNLKIVAFAPNTATTPDNQLYSLPDITTEMDFDEISHALAVHYDPYYQRLLIISPSLQLIALYPQLHQLGRMHLKYATNFIVLGDLPPISDRLVGLSQKLTLPITYDTISTSRNGIFVSTSVKFDPKLTEIKSQRSRTTLFIEYDIATPFPAYDDIIHPQSFPTLKSTTVLNDITHDEESITTRDLSFFQPTDFSKELLQIGDKCRFRPSNITHHPISPSPTPPLSTPVQTPSGLASFQLDIFNSTDVSWPHFFGILGQDGRDSVDLIPPQERLDKNGQPKTTFEFFPVGSFDDEGSATRYPSITRFDTAYTLSSAVSLSTWLSPSAIPEEGCLYIDESALLDDNHDDTHYANYQSFSMGVTNDSFASQDGEEVQIVDDKVILKDLKLDQQKNKSTSTQSQSVYGTADATLKHYKMLPPSPLLFVLTTEGTLLILQIKLDCQWWSKNWSAVMQVSTPHSSVTELKLASLLSCDKLYYMDQDPAEEQETSPIVAPTPAFSFLPNAPKAFGAPELTPSWTAFPGTQQEQQQQQQTKPQSSSHHPHSSDNWQQCPTDLESNNNSIFDFKSAIGGGDYDDDEHGDANNNNNNEKLNEIDSITANHPYTTHSFHQSGSLDPKQRQMRSGELMGLQKNGNGVNKGQFTSFSDLKNPSQQPNADVNVKDCIKLDPKLPKGDKGIEYLMSLLETTNGYVNSIAKDANVSSQTIAKALGTGPKDSDGFFIEETMTLHDLISDTADEMNAIASGLKARAQTIVECQGQQLKTYLALTTAIKQAKLIQTQKAPSTSIRSIDLASCYLLVYGKYVLYKNLLQHQKEAIATRSNTVRDLFPSSGNNNNNNNINLPQQYQQRNAARYNSFLIDQADEEINGLLLFQTVDPTTTITQRHYQQHTKLKSRNGLHDLIDHAAATKPQPSSIKTLTRPRRRLKVGMVGLGSNSNHDNDDDDDDENNDTINTSSSLNDSGLNNSTIYGQNRSPSSSHRVDFHSLSQKYFNFSIAIAQALSVLRQRMISFDSRIQCFLSKIHHGKVTTTTKDSNHGLSSLKSSLYNDLVYTSIMSTTKSLSKSANIPYQATDGTIGAFYQSVFGPQCTPVAPPSTVQSLLTKPFPLYRNVPQIVVVQAAATDGGVVDRPAPEPTQPTQPKAPQPIVQQPQQQQQQAKIPTQQIPNKPQQQSVPSDKRGDEAGPKKVESRPIATPAATSGFGTNTNPIVRGFGVLPPGTTTTPTTTPPSSFSFGSPIVASSKTSDDAPKTQSFGFGRLGGTTPVASGFSFGSPIATPATTTAPTDPAPKSSFSFGVPPPAATTTTTAPAQPPTASTTKPPKPMQPFSFGTADDEEEEEDEASHRGKRARSKADDEAPVSLNAAAVSPGPTDKLAAKPETTAVADDAKKLLTPAPFGTTNPSSSTTFSFNAKPGAAPIATGFGAVTAPLAAEDKTALKAPGSLDAQATNPPAVVTTDATKASAFLFGAPTTTAPVNNKPDETKVTPAPAAATTATTPEVAKTDEPKKEAPATLPVLQVAPLAAQTAPATNLFATTTAPTANMFATTTAAAAAANVFATTTAPSNVFATTAATPAAPNPFVSTPAPTAIPASNASGNLMNSFAAMGGAANTQTPIKPAQNFGFSAAATKSNQSSSFSNNLFQTPTGNNNNNNNNNNINNNSGLANISFGSPTAAQSLSNPMSQQFNQPNNNPNSAPAQPNGQFGQGFGSVTNSFNSSSYSAMGIGTIGSGAPRPASRPNATASGFAAFATNNNAGGGGGAGGGNGFASMASSTPANGFAGAAANTNGFAAMANNGAGGFGGNNTGGTTNGFAAMANNGAGGFGGNNNNNNNGGFGGNNTGGASNGFAAIANNGTGGFGGNNNNNGGFGGNNNNNNGGFGGNNSSFGNGNSNGFGNQNNNNNNNGFGGNSFGRF